MHHSARTIKPSNSLTMEKIAHKLEHFGTGGGTSQRSRITMGDFFFVESFYENLTKQTGNAIAGQA